MASSICEICHRTLTRPESIAAGIGPVCAAKLKSRMERAEQEQNPENVNYDYIGTLLLRVQNSINIIQNFGYASAEIIKRLESMLADMHLINIDMTNSLAKKDFKDAYKHANRIALTGEFMLDALSGEAIFQSRILNHVCNLFDIINDYEYSQKLGVKYNPKSKLLRKKYNSGDLFCDAKQ